LRVYSVSGYLILSSFSTSRWLISVPRFVEMNCL
jgi:hypothetical protein